MKQKDIGQVIFAVFLIVSLAVSGLIVAKVNYNINKNVQDVGYGLSEDQLEQVDNLNNTINSSFDAGIVIALILSFVVLIITTLLISTNPLFFVFGFLYYLGSLILIPIAANIYIKMHNVSSLIEVAHVLPMTNLIIGNYVMICIILSTIDLAVLYMRSKA